MSLIILFNHTMHVCIEITNTKDDRKKLKQNKLKRKKFSTRFQIIF